MLASYRRPRAVTSMSRSHSWDRTSVLTLPDEVTASCYQPHNQGTHPQVPGGTAIPPHQVWSRALHATVQIHLTVLLPWCQKEKYKRSRPYPGLTSTFCCGPIPLFNSWLLYGSICRILAPGTGACECVCVWISLSQHTKTTKPRRLIQASDSKGLNFRVV